MQKKLSKELIAFLILIPIFLWIAFYTAGIRGSNIPAYSVINKSNQGYSVFYDSLQELGYRVDRSMRPIIDHSYEGVQIIVDTAGFSISDDDIKDWVKLGGILVFMWEDHEPVISYATKTSSQWNVDVFLYEKGGILSLKSDALLNSTLIRNHERAYQLLQTLEGFGNRDIYFSELNLFAPNNNLTLWDHLPLAYKFILYQLIIVVVAFFYFKGKGFGKPIPLYEEEERIENEYVHTAAALYMQGSCWDIILDVYYKSLLKLLRSSEENLYSVWESKGLPETNKLKRLIAYMDKPHSDKTSKESIEMILIIEDLKKQIRKGRETHWKTLKKAQ